MSNNPLPLPLKKLELFNSMPPLTKSEPVKVEPLSILSTTNPLSGNTDAVTLPLAIKFDINTSSANAVLGMLNRSLPLPLNTLPLANLTSPKNNDPLSVEVTINPLLGDTEAVTLPLIIRVDIKTSSANADLGMSNNPTPLPLKKFPVWSVTLPDIFIEPVNWEPDVGLSTLNPISSPTDAVTLPLAIKLDTSTSSANAVLGILNNPSPLPL